MFRIRTPSRIHLTLIDLWGGLGRVDGGVGISLQNPHFVLEARKIRRGIRVQGPFRDEIMVAAKKVLAKKMVKKGVDFRVLECYEKHVGLGSGTQAALSAGMAVNKLYKVNLSVREIARTVGRGGTSGIGVAAFESGGFILDGGHMFGPDEEKSQFLPSRASKAGPPPILLRHDFPTRWAIVMALPSIMRGASGIGEIDIFSKLCPIDKEDVQKLCHIILMQLLPAMMENDIERFGEAINEIQQTGFNKIYGIEQQHPIIGKLIRVIGNSGAAGSGMSSFGPVTFGFVDEKSVDPKTVRKAAQSLLNKTTGGKTWITRARNQGAEIERVR